MQQERVRISDIAQELGLSTATVSNVIHGKTKKVSAETVKRVQELLEKRRYIPNMAGILLAQNSSRIFGVVINDHPKYEGHVLEDGFIAASLNALSGECAGADYFLMIKTTQSWQEIPVFASMWNMAGLILIGFCQQDYQSLRDRIRIPFVIYDGMLQGGSRLVNLVVDNYDGGRQMGLHLKALGHERVLCISDNAVHVDQQRYLGLCDVLPQAERLLIPMEKWERWRLYQERKAYLLHFTAVFAVSDYYAVDLMHFLWQEGISVPQQLSVAGFDGSMLSGWVHPELTSIGQNHEERARLAVSLLQRLGREEETRAEYVLPVSLIVRSSTRALEEKER